MPGTPADLRLLPAGLAAFLAAASLTGAVLARGQGAASPTVRNLNARISVRWVMATLLAPALVFGQAGAVVLFAICSFAALREFLTLTDTRRADHMALAAAFFVVIPVQ